MMLLELKEYYTTENIYIYIIYSYFNLQLLTLN